MAPRLARSSIQSSAPKTAKSKTRKRTLDAYAIASHSTAPKRPVRQSRLGEYLDDAPKQKRRNRDEDDEESGEEDAPSSSKRRRTAEDGEGGDEGSDSEGNEWRLGGLRSDDEDSELDSDEAFGESDEEKFEGFAFRGSKSVGGKGKKIAQGSTRRVEVEEDGGMDLDEEEGGRNEEDDDFGDEGVDLATMLDDDDEEVLGGKDDTLRDLGEESASDEDDDDDEMESVSESYATSDDDDDGQNDLERAARMRDRLDAIYAPPPTSTPSKSAPRAITIDDILATTDATSKALHDSALKTRKKSTRSATESAPLPKRQQDRLNRSVATEKAKEQLDRWRDTVIQNRRAEFLSFPLKHTDEVDPIGKDKFIVDNAPQNELEEKIQKIMEESGLSAPDGKRGQAAEEDAILAAEGLEAGSLPVEEVMRRRAELRRTRDLLFREERRAKRISKIKSKAYRRVHRRERQRLAQVEEGLRGSDDDAEDSREAGDRKRAMARMSTKHRDSKFAKSLRETGRAGWDEGAREGVVEEARRREELVRRVRGKDVGEQGNSDASDGEGDEDWDGEDGEDRLRGDLDQLKGDGRNGVGEGKGLQGMKFMRAADERRRAQNDEDVERLRKEMAVLDGDEVDSEDEGFDEQGLGRAVFGPKPKVRLEQIRVKRGEMEEADEEEEGEAGEAEVDVITEKPSDLAARGKEARNRPLEKAVKASKSTSEPGYDSAWAIPPPPEPSTNWITTKTNRHKAITSEPAIDTSLSEPSAKAPGKAQGSSNNTVADPDTTHHYHTLAFAGDSSVTTSFAADKAALAVEEDEQEVSTHLPGWGSWTGNNLPKSLRRANQRKAHNPLFKTKTPGGVHPSDRKDAGRADVIVSEKRLGKGGREYLAKTLPRGFETREQYERSLRVPLGGEWVTKEVLQRGVRPRVVVGRGRVVEALERPMV